MRTESTTQSLSSDYLPGRQVNGRPSGSSSAPTVVSGTSRAMPARHQSHRRYETSEPADFACRNAGRTVSHLGTQNCLYRTSPFTEGPQYAVKIVAPEYPEADMYEELLKDRNPRNPTLPVEVLDKETRPILLMPCVSDTYDLELRQWSTSKYLQLFLQIVQVRHVLSRDRAPTDTTYPDNSYTGCRISARSERGSWRRSPMCTYKAPRVLTDTQDICTGNIVVVTERDAQLHKQLTAGRIYFIDFETSRRLSLPPGKQHALPLPEAQYRRRLKDLTHFDPYSWDIYCLGRLFGYLSFEVRSSHSGRLRLLIAWPLQSVYQRRKVPWIVHSYHRWLLGDEKGCMRACRCRPTARRVRQMITVMIWVAHISELCEGLVMRIHRFITSLFARPSLISSGH